jgi:hypothetical protein
MLFVSDVPKKNAFKNDGPGIDGEPSFAPRGAGTKDADWTPTCCALRQGCLGMLAERTRFPRLERLGASPYLLFGRFEDDLSNYGVCCNLCAKRSEREW